jgi:ribonuclease Z
MLEGYRDLERQNTPFEIIPLEPEGTVEIKNNIFLRGFKVEHTVPTYGYSVYERRTKLKQELIGLPQEKLKELKDKGEEITRTLYIPLIAYVMDTAAGPALVREDVREAQSRAKSGMHLHVRDFKEWMAVLECQKVVLGHISRRTHLVEARKQLQAIVGRQKAERIELLMDTRTNKERYERQQMDAGEHPTQLRR